MKYAGFYLAFIYIIIRIVAFYMGASDDQYKYLVSVNLLFIVLSISGAMYHNYRSGEEKVLFPDEMKVAMRAVSAYAIILTVFVFTFYKWIDSGFEQRKIDAYRYELEQKEYETLPDVDNPLLIFGITKEEFIEREVEKASTFLSPFSQSTLTLVGIMAAGIIYSLLMVFLRLKFLPLFLRK